MSLTVKVYIEDEVRRFSLDSSQGVKFCDLQRAVEEVLPSLKGSVGAFTYEDDEGDTITATTQHEFIEAIRLMNSLGDTVPKFRLKKSKKNTVLLKKATTAPSHEPTLIPPSIAAEESTPVHFGVRCDGCHMYPIVGERYKCALRPNFDLCASCNVLSKSPPFVEKSTVVNKDKKRTPAATPGTAAAAGTRATPAAVHLRIRCDECNVCPIVGVRFSCMRRCNFDLCEKCEAKKEQQPFAMRKFYKPATFTEQFQNRTSPNSPDFSSVVAELPVTCESCSTQLNGGQCAYKCTHRSNYFLCEACEARKVPSFPTVKIYALSDGSPRRPVPPRAEQQGNSVFNARIAGASSSSSVATATTATAPSTRALAPATPASTVPIRSHAFSPNGSSISSASAVSSVSGGGSGGSSSSSSSSCLVRDWEAQCRSAGHSVVAPAVSTLLSGIDTLAAAVTGHNKLVSSAPWATTLQQQRSHKNATSTSATSAPVTMVTPKPSLKFIRDATLPDGTTVPPCAVLEKQWLVCNDGRADWPEGVVLCTAGGDILTSVLLGDLFPLTFPFSSASAGAGNGVDTGASTTTSDSSTTTGSSTAVDTTSTSEGSNNSCSSGGGGSNGDFAVAVIHPPLRAGEQRVISVTVCVPEGAGRYVSYFRMKTAQGRRFGQRLWADVVVVTPATTEKVSAAVSPVLTSAPAPSATSTSRSISSSTSTSSRMGSSAVASIMSPSPPAPAVGLAAAPASAPAGPAAVSTQGEPSGSADPAAELADQGDWERELVLLAEMGFCNRAAILPLLQAHVNKVERQRGATSTGTGGTGAAATAAVDAEGLRRVVASLLGL